jgi:tetratricopeptide (TPR) repeat protein
VLDRLGRADDVGPALAARRQRRDGGTLDRLRFALGTCPRAVLGPVPEPDDVVAWVAGGEVLAERGEWEPAIGWFARAVEADPEHLQARVRHAWARYLLEIDPRWAAEARALARALPDPRLAREILRDLP